MATVDKDLVPADVRETVEVVEDADDYGFLDRLRSLADRALTFQEKLFEMADADLELYLRLHTESAKARFAALAVSLPRVVPSKKEIEVRNRGRTSGRPKLTAADLMKMGVTAESLRQIKSALEANNGRR